MNATELATYLGTTRKAIYARVHRDSIPYSKMGRNLIFDKNKIDDEIARNSNYIWE